MSACGLVYMCIFRNVLANNPPQKEGIHYWFCIYVYIYSCIYICTISSTLLNRRTHQCSCLYCVYELRWFAERGTHFADAPARSLSSTGVPAMRPPAMPRPPTGPPHGFTMLPPRTVGHSEVPAELQLVRREDAATTNIAQMVINVMSGMTTMQQQNNDAIQSMIQMQQQSMNCMMGCLGKGYLLTM